MPIDFPKLCHDFLAWAQAGHQAIMWLSGATGLSAGLLLVILAYLGRNVLKFLMKLVLVAAIILFLLSWCAGSGLPLPGTA